MTAKQKRANLIFKDGRMVQVPVNSAEWPKTIDHKEFIQIGAVLRDETRAVRESVVTFQYCGMQYGIAAYVEQVP